MADKILEVINCLRLNELKDDWVKSVWESDFTEVELTDDGALIQNAEELSQLLQTLRTELTAYAGETQNEGLWVTMMEKDISLKALIAYLAHLIVTGHKKSSSVDETILGCWAAQLYTKLLLVPGSGAFKVFHPELYEKSVDYLKQIWTLGTTAGSKRKKSSSPIQASQARKKTKKRRKDKQGPTEEDDTDMPSSQLSQDGSQQQNSDEEDGETREMTPQDRNRIQTSLKALLVDITTLLESFSLRQSVLCATHTVQILTTLSRLDAESFDGNFDSRVPNRIRCIPTLAFKGLCFLCSQLHGNTSSVMFATCKGLLPSLLYLVGNQPVQTITKPLQQIQDHTISFILYLLKQNGDRVQGSLRVLLQHMCTKVTDRSEYRTKVAQAVVTLAGQFSDESYSKMIQWFYKLSKHSQMTNRSFAIEIVSTLLSGPERQVKDDIAPEILPYLSHRSLLGILIDRCSDKAPTVRARAIACFGQCLSSKDEGIASTVREIMTPQVAGRQAPRPRLIHTPGPQNMAETVTEEPTRTSENVTIEQEGSTIATEREGQEAGTESVAPLLQRVVLTPGFDPNLSDSEGLFSMLRRRAKDDKVNVRKAAIQAIENAIRFEAPHYTKQNVEVLRDHCRDPGLSVRKQAMQSLTETLMEMPNDKFLQKNWLLGVLPLVLDRESTLSQKCFEILEDVILGNVVLKVRSTSNSHQLAWSLLGIIAEPHSVDQRRYLQKACYHWSRQGKIKSALITALETHIGTDNNEAAWMLLAEIAPAAPKIGHSLLMKYWKEQENQESNIEIMGQALTVTKYVVKHLPAEDREWLITDLKSRLLAFRSPPEVISATVITLAKMCEIQYSETGNKSKKTAWCHELLSASDKYLSRVILQETASPSDEESVICHLFTLGEVVQLCPASVPKRIFLLVQSMIATPCIASLPPSQSQPMSQNDHSQSADTSDKVENRSGDGDSMDSGEGSVHSQDSQGSQGSQFTQTSQSSQPLTQFRGSTMSERVRAFAFITFGKLCLQHETLAKKCIAALARELEISTNTAIRNNVMIVMCDLCVRYTTTANNYISNIASLLKDPSPLLRKQAVTLITRLLQEDFLKWKGALFFRFIFTIFDEFEEIRTFSEYCLLHMLLHRHPKILFQHFIECLFHFNDYSKHTVYNQFKQTEKDRENFSLKGNKNRKKREQLYKFLLENMKDEHRFQIQSKISQEILGAVVDGILPFDDATKDLLKDALFVLSCKEIKLTTLRVSQNEDVMGDEQEMAAIVVAVAKKTIITQVLKKNVIENIVPIVISLKHMMEKERSPLLSDLMLYLRELMKDYKNEVKDILTADKQLASEIEYDLRKYDEQEQQKQQAGGVAQGPQSAAGSPVPVPQGRNSRPGTPLVTPGALSPRGPEMKDTVESPKAAPSPKMPAPVMSLVRPNMASPARTTQLATLAVLNAARKRMEIIQDNGENPAGVPESGENTKSRTPISIETIQNSGGNPAGVPESGETTKSRTPISIETIQNSGENPVGVPESQENTRSRISMETTGQEATPSPGTPSEAGRSRPKIHRAISTPAVAMGNITFQGDGNMTFMPPSPISEHQSMQRIYDDTLNDKENEDNSLSLNSPNIRSEKTGLPDGQLQGENGSPKDHVTSNCQQEVEKDAKKKGTNSADNVPCEKQTLGTRKHSRKK